MKKMVFTIVVIASLLTLSYLALSKGNDLSTPNMAAKRCIDLGYSYRVEKTASAQTGVCEFPDGSKCDVWEFYNGKCGKKWLYGYEVFNCSSFGEYRNYYRFEEKSRTIYAFVTVNCESDEILVERGEKRVKIIERDYDGLLARCLCQKEVRIYNTDEVVVEFVNLGNESVVIEKATEKESFCGISTFAECEKDLDCKIGGCSAQVCMGIREEIFTTCEYRECYDRIKFGMDCKCVSGKCQWTKN